MNNDYIVGELVRQRHADYLHEVERDELAATAHRRPPSVRPGPARAATRARPARRGWGQVLAGLVARARVAGGHRS